MLLSPLVSLVFLVCSGVLLRASWLGRPLRGPECLVGPAGSGCFYPYGLRLLNRALRVSVCGLHFSLGGLFSAARTAFICLILFSDFCLRCQRSESHRIATQRLEVVTCMHIRIPEIEGRYLHDIAELV